MYFLFLINILLRLMLVLIAMMQIMKIKINLFKQVSMQVINSEKNRFKFNYQYHNNKRTFIDDSISVGGFSKYQNGLYSGKSHFVEFYSNLFINKNISLLVGTDFRINNTNQKYFITISLGAI